MTYLKPLTPTRETRIKKVATHRQRGIVLVLEDIHDPHNGAAIFRTCDALGIQNVHLIFQEQEPFNPRTIGKSSSSSANKWLDFTIHTIDKTTEDATTVNVTENALLGLRKEGYTLFAAALKEGAETLYGLDFTAYKKIALLVGNEHKGLSTAALRLSDHCVIIPMHGFVESLNVSVAAALFLAEITRQRQATGEYLLPENEKNKLIENFHVKASKRVKAC